MTKYLTCSITHALQINVKQGKTVRFMQLAMGTGNDMVSFLRAHRTLHKLHVSFRYQLRVLHAHVQSRCRGLS